jgi:teichuronic acid biosynthesis glycosyltransferase TuaC
MRILILTKRQYMGRDLLDDRYGRFRELSLALASKGHQVDGVCLSYRLRDEGTRKDSSAVGRVEWQSLNLLRLLDPGAKGYWRAIDRMTASGRPDVIWACSDAPHALLGLRAARRLGAKVVIDLYDNFESYGLTRLPGMRGALRRSVVEADGVTCVSQPLAEFVRDQYGYAGRIPGHRKRGSRRHFPTYGPPRLPDRIESAAE